MLVVCVCCRVLFDVVFDLSVWFSGCCGLVHVFSGRSCLVFGLCLFCCACVVGGFSLFGVFLLIKNDARCFEHCLNICWEIPG